MTTEYGPLAPDSTDVLRDLEAMSFHFDYQDEEWARDSGGIEPERSEVARDDGRVVGHTSPYSLRVAVPGAPAAAVAGSPGSRLRSRIDAVVRCAGSCCAS